VTRRVRVLHVIQNLNYGGMERLFADLVRLLDRDRFESHVLVLGYFGHFAEGLEQFASLHPPPRLSRWSLVHPGALADQIRAIAPDVVHSHAGVWYKAARASRMAGVPRIVHTEHGRERPDPWLARRIGRLASGYTDVVVAVSDALAEQLRRTVVRYPDRVQTILNGVDTDEHAPRADDGTVRTELGIPSGTPIIGSVGRLEPIKGYDLMVEAFARLCGEEPQPAGPVLVIAGDGSERPRLVARVQELGLDGRVFLLGWRRDLASLYQAFDLFVMTSRSEGTSVSLLEAMSSGLCPVVTAVGGNAAVLGAELQHRLVEGLDPETIAAGWRDALAGEGARTRDGARARVRVETRFSLRSMTRAYEDLYSSVRKVPSPRRSAEKPPSM